MNDATKWLDEARGNDSVREVARKIGTTHSTLNRQASEGTFSFEIARDISRVYGRSVIADLIATGHLTPEDTGAEGIERALHAATDAQLVLEMARRLEATNIGTIYDKPITEAINEAEATVHQLPARRSIPKGMVANTSINEHPEETRGHDADMEGA